MTTARMPPAAHTHRPAYVYLLQALQAMSAGQLQQLVEQVRSSQYRQVTAYNITLQRVPVLSSNR